MPNPIDPYDPKELIADAYRIAGINAPDCRTIFLEWAMSAPQTGTEAITALIARHGTENPGHPMTGILQDALVQQTAPTSRKGGRSARKIK